MLDRTAIEARVLRAYTGNHHRDLLGFALGEEFDLADEAWHHEAARRYEEAEFAKKLGVAITRW